jgi:hypothetical protein
LEKAAVKPLLAPVVEAIEIEAPEAKPVSFADKILLEKLPATEKKSSYIDISFIEPTSVQVCYLCD